MSTVYIDLFFMINFSMDFLCIFLTSKLLSLRLTVLRALLASALGGIYACAALFSPFSGALALVFDGIAALLLAFAAFFRRGEGKRIFGTTAVYVAISAVLGGFMTVLFNLFNRTRLFDALKGGKGDGISVWLFALFAAISALITYASGKFFSSKMSKKSAHLELTYKGRSIRLLAMTDSGNLLREPISGKPCIIVSPKSLKKLLPPALCKGSGYDLSLFEGLPHEDRRRILVIPSTTASGDGMLIGLRADKIQIESRGKMYEVDAVIALSSTEICAEGADALLPPSLLIH